MGFIRQLSSVSGVSRGSGMRAMPSWAPDDDRWYDTDRWTGMLSDAGLSISPDLALTLTYVHCAVSTISDDFGTMSCQCFKDLGDQGRERVKYTDRIIGPLSYRLRWQPNLWQSAKAFWSTLAWQYLLRPRANAEIIYRPGMDGIIDQVIPRHPDRVREEVLPSGRLRYQIMERDGHERPVLQEDMLVVRNTSADGLNAISRTHYGAKALLSGATLQEFTRNYFNKGATASIVATYKGAQMEPDEERNLHGSISRYMAGVENAGGLLLIPEDIDTKALGVEPEKAQLLGLKEYSGRDVARLFKMPPHKLGIAGTQTYASQVQSAQEYVTGCQMPLVVEFEQAIQISLIADPRYFSKFNMDYIVRADLKTRMEAYEIGIRSRILRPSEARIREDLNPDAKLDELSELDHRAGSPKSAGNQESANQNQTETGGQASRLSGDDVRAVLMLHDAAARCVRRERVAVEKLAKKHPSDVAAWQSELRSFYADHAGFVAQTMRMPLSTARAYAAQHGTLIADKGIVEMSDHWERQETEDLAVLAVEHCEVAA